MPPTTDLSASCQPKPIFGIGSIAVAGFIAGPVAPAYLVVRNIATAKVPQKATGAIAFFAGALAVWVWSILSVPRDALSEIAIHVPQALVWWLATWLLLRTEHRAYAEVGGEFRSLWVAVGIALLVSIVLRLLFRAALP